MDIKFSLRTVIVGGVFLLSAVAPRNAFAGVITFEMEGTVVSASVPIPGISLGDPFTASRPTPASPQD